MLVTSVDAPVNPGDLPIAHMSFGNPDLTSEHLMAYEMGYRVHASDKFSIDLAAYYDHYTDLIYSVDGTPFTGTEFGTSVNVDPTLLKNGETGNVYGGELEARWKLPSRTMLTTGFSMAKQDKFSQGTTIMSPKYQAFCRLSKDFPSNLKADAMLYWYDAIPEIDQSSYCKLDLHLSWRPADGNTEISFGAQDLLLPRSVQFMGASAIPRSAYLQLTTHF
jgi:iron complex outermembrane receptor protein